MDSKFKVGEIFIDHRSDIYKIYSIHNNLYSDREINPPYYKSTFDVGGIYESECISLSNYKLLTILYGFEL